MPIIPNKKIEVFVQRFIPDFIREQYPAFVDFIQQYLNFIDSPGEPQDIVNHLLFDNDIDVSIDKFATEYKQKYLANASDYSVAQLKLIIKNIRQFYLKKGTEDALRFILRAFYDAQETEIVYPNEHILYASGGRWINPTKIFIKKSDGSPLSSTELQAINRFNIDGFYDTYVTSVGYENSRSYVIVNKKVTFNPNDQITFTDNNSPLTYTVDSIVYEQGFFDKGLGLVSGSSKLQDNFYYQKLSYVVKTSISIDKYRKLVEKLNHPAGRKLFGQISAFNQTGPVSIKSVIEILFRKHIEVLVVEQKRIAYYEAFTSFANVRTGNNTFPKVYEKNTIIPNVVWNKQGHPIIVDTVYVPDMVNHASLFNNGMTKFFPDYKTLAVHKNSNYTTINVPNKMKGLSGSDYILYDYTINKNGGYVALGFSG